MEETSWLEASLLFPPGYSSVWLENRYSPGRMHQAVGFISALGVKCLCKKSSSVALSWNNLALPLERPQDAWEHKCCV